MSLTLANATAEVRSALNEPLEVFWSDSELQTWIKEGVRNFSSKTLMVEDDQSLTLVADQITYSSSDESWIGDVIEIYTTLLITGTQYKGLIKVHPRQLGNLATRADGPPKYYTLHNRKIWIWPVPTSAVAAASTLQILFAKETDDITQISDEFQHLPIIYAIAKAKQKDMKFSESAALLSQFFQELSFERSDKHAREVDSLDKFRIKSTGGGPESARG